MSTRIGRTHDKTNVSDKLMGSDTKQVFLVLHFENRNVIEYLFYVLNAVLIGLAGVRYFVT